MQTPDNRALDLHKLSRFTNPLLACRESFATDFTVKFAKAIRDDSCELVGCVAMANLNYFMQAAPDPFVQASHASGATGLIPSLIMACKGYRSATDSLCRLLQTPDADLVNKFVTYTASFNFISFIGATLRYSVDHVAPTLSKPVQYLISILTAHCSQRTTNGGDQSGHSRQRMALYLTSQRVWHDTFKSLQDIKPQTSLPLADLILQARLKHHALQAWKDYGLSLRLREDDTDVVTLKGPSEPCAEGCGSARAATAFSTVTFNVRRAIGTLVIEMYARRCDELPKAMSPSNIIDTGQGLQVPAVEVRQTFLAQAIARGEDFDPDDVPWYEVLSREPETIVAWIKFMHKEHWEIVFLLSDLTEVLEDEEECTKIWPAVAADNLPGVLMKIILDPDTFSEDESSFHFTDLNYGNDVLTTLAPCLTMLRRILEPDDWEETASQRDVQCVYNILDTLPQFCERMWGLRHFIQIPKEEFPREIANDTFQSSAILCVATMACLHEDILILPELDVLAAHFLLYSWTYSSDEDEARQVLQFVYRLLKADDSDSGREQFVKTLMASNDGFPTDFVDKICYYLRDESLVGKDAQVLLRILQVMTMADAEKVLVRVALADNSDLLQSVMTAQMFATDAVVLTFQLLGAAVNVERYKNFCGKYNFIATLACATMDVVGLGDPDYLKIVKALLLAHSAIWGKRPRAGPPSASHQSSVESTKRIWHDTLESLKAVRTFDAAHSMVKADGLDAWRKLGSLLHLADGVNVKTLHVPSDLSQERAYWKIPKRCFYNPCACSFRANHHLRVCKGCFRALYCNLTCQNSDWKAGHRLLCKGSADAD
ncbi:hypothetical protein EIP91_001731 [Steccherinum ochraceum]|uniref:MYND-type domain-containing protein n=1 Tax=Steccherinum ochraceum TaxID=92696 RepID=A0A4R0RFS6_9APHY|nr:hypothetical protein EIP91_001731 [Steccherinum ochraceum]